MKTENLTKAIYLERSFNPYLGHFGNVMKRLLWTENPHLIFKHWSRDTSTKIFNSMTIWNYKSDTTYISFCVITWRDLSEISRDKWKIIEKPGNIVERPLWTENPHVYGDVVERHLWTENTHLGFAETFKDFSKKMIFGTSWSVFWTQNPHFFSY